MKLRDLLEGIAVVEATADMEKEITSVVYDTRKPMEKDCLFVALKGFVFDGNTYIDAALASGAAAVVTAVKPENTDIPYILVESDRLALALLGRNFYGNPCKDMCIIGVTGTNGKTSVTLLLSHVLQKTLGAKVGLIGTMENRIGQQVIPTSRTTPESFELQALLAQMRQNGCTHVVMEVSSHAIALHRVGGMYFDVAAFTNLSEDHLDFHKTMEAYCDTKAELFSRCRRAVLNGDDAWFSRIQPWVKCPMVTTSVKGNGELKAENVQLQGAGISFMAVTREEEVAVTLPIPGRFTVYNALTVLGIARQLGISLQAAAEALKSAPGVQGRVEVVPTPGKPYTVLIDYAHTPDGLENVLRSARDFCKGRLIAVFGCGGDRDRQKRPIMGKIAVELSDFAVITSDNPRTENPMDIIREIELGAKQAQGEYCVIENRKNAIAYALDIGQKDDIIVLAGKGHETYQEICGVKHHLDEREVVAEHLAKMRDTNG